MSYNYNSRNMSSQEDDDNYCLSEEDSYLENDLKNNLKFNSKISFDKGSEEYKRRREKNNEAVRRSREKAKIKYNQKEELIMKLRLENEKLENAAASLRKELKIYQDIAKGMNLELIDETNFENRTIKIERFNDY